MTTLFMAHLISSLSGLSWVLAVLVPLEIFQPRERLSWSSRLRGCAIWMAYAVLSAAILSTLGVAAKALGLGPFLPALPMKGLTGAVATGAISALIADFCLYWCHRAQHRWFWPSHAVHHSLREMSATNSYLHWTEAGVRTLLVSVPASLLSPQGPQAAVITSLVLLQGYFAHTSTRLSLGGLRYLFVDNCYHRIHHSLEPRHFHKNFAGTLPIWDILFRTAYFPLSGEWPNTGLADQPEPVGIVDYFFRPFTPGVSGRSAER